MLEVSPYLINGKSVLYRALNYVVTSVLFFQVYSQICHCKIAIGGSSLMNLSSENTATCVFTQKRSLFHINMNSIYNYIKNVINKPWSKKMSQEI